MKKIVFLLFCLTILICANAYADDVPKLINYQGKLTDAGGDPMTGTKTVTFEIYDGVAGGSPVWGPEEHTVTLSQGHFNVVLGSIMDISGAFDAENRYLQLTVDGQEITPRQQVLSAPYAINSDRVQGRDLAADHDSLQTAYNTLLSRVEELEEKLVEVVNPDYVSDWIKAPKNETLYLEHNLDTMDFKHVSVIGSNDQNGSYPTWVVGVSSSGTGQYGHAVQAVSNNAIRVATYPNGGMYAVGFDFEWTGPATYIRVKIWK